MLIFGIMQHFRFYHKEDVLQLTRIRRYETKLGEVIQVLPTAENVEEALAASSAQLVIFGIPEDIGVKANMGVGGAHTAWFPFLNAWLNMQSNDFLNGKEILLLGHFDFTDVENLIETYGKGAEEKTEAYRHAVSSIDEEVEVLTKCITAAGKIPIAIGGGHNNAYPLIKGAAKGLYKLGKIPLAQINCVNLDAHTDYRPLEGRHSGNAFRYAEEDGYLQKYCVIGVHESYIPQNVWMDIVNNPFIDLLTYEDIFIREKQNFIQAVAHAAGFTEDGYTGIELDVDAVENILSSAVAPSGVSAVHARQYVSLMAQYARPAYLHICEGATLLDDGRRNETTGKLISYIVSDFTKAFLSESAS